MLIDKRKLFRKERRQSATEDDGGFTLIELMVVVLILGILVLIAINSYNYTISHAYRITCLDNQRTFNSAVNVYLSVNGGYPTTLADMTDYVHSFNKVSRCPKDGRPLDYDPNTHSVSCVNHPFP